MHPIERDPTVISRREAGRRPIQGWSSPREVLRVDVHRQLLVQHLVPDCELQPVTGSNLSSIHKNEEFKQVTAYRSPTLLQHTLTRRPGTVRFYYSCSNTGAACPSVKMLTAALVMTVSDHGQA